MTAPENILARLERLLETGAMPGSAASRALLGAIGPLIDSGVIAIRRSGGGRGLVVRDRAALRAFIDATFPNLAVPAGLTARAAGVGRFRDSKAFRSDTPEIISVRAWADDALLVGGRPAGAAAATETHGVFSFLLGGAKPHSLCGECALVENPAMFTKFELLRLPARIVIYGHGRLSNRAIEWLASCPAADFSLAHLPDYDPAGLIEFERLRSRLGGRIRLHVPSDLDESFARFSNRALLERPNSRAMLATLRRSSSDDVRKVVELMDKHNAGLEQEALLLAGLTKSENGRC